MAWNRVVETPADSVCVERVDDGLAVFHPNDLEVVDRRRVRVDVQHAAVGTGEELAVVRRTAARRAAFQPSRRSSLIERIAAWSASRRLLHS